MCIIQTKNIPRRIQNGVVGDAEKTIDIKPRIMDAETFIIFAVVVAGA
jgi:hypothetical protein